MSIFRHYREAINTALLVITVAAPGGFVIAQQDEPVTEPEPVEQPAESAQQSAIEAMANKPVISIEQITVTGQRSSYLLRAQIEDAKKSLYSSYNDLNLDDEFDVNCRKSDWTGTHIRQLICWPAFFERAISENSQDFLRGNAVLEPVAQLQTQYQGKFDELRMNLIKVAGENSEVEEALIELGTLEAAY
ncbi:MAG: hypothetical protein KJN90_04325, partial [Gammaproteobacteria bacterium]|nr:hypothetical protein [Gammaproteobacteria bacterium]